MTSNPTDSISDADDAKQSEREPTNVQDRNDADIPQRLDPRRNAFRETLARRGLEGSVIADRFVDGQPARVARATIPLRKSPDPALGFETEALFGEPVTILDEEQGWAWVQLDGDGYVGYAPASAFSYDAPEVSHRVRALGTFVYPEPNIKRTPIMHLPLNSMLAVVSETDGFAELATGGFVVSRHLLKTDKYARDYVDVAERFVTTPYLWGGKTRIGIDCSGLVQTSLFAAGIAAPRDSDMQQAELGSTIRTTDDYAGLRRGDLVFWQGHVAIMIDAVLLVHANAHHMAVAIETLPEVVQRNLKDGQAMTEVRRLEKLSAEV